MHMNTRRSTKRGDRPSSPAPILDSFEDAVGFGLESEAERPAKAGRGRFEDAIDSEFNPADDREPLVDELHADAEEPEDDSHSPDDALGLYLRQMGAIPLLNRKQELFLAQQLEMRRSRYRHAALSCWRTLAKVVEAFDRVLRGDLALDPTIDVVNTLGLTRENILKRMPIHLPTMRNLIREADADFRDLLKATSARERGKAQRKLYRNLVKTRTLAEELSPRIDLLDLFSDHLRAHLVTMRNVEAEAECGGNGAADRERRSKALK
jgi:RNA polymerase primary sigma factor